MQPQKYSQVSFISMRNVGTQPNDREVLKYIIQVAAVVVQLKQQLSSQAKASPSALEFVTVIITSLSLHNNENNQYSRLCMPETQESNTCWTYFLSHFHVVSFLFFPV